MPPIYIINLKKSTNTSSVDKAWTHTHTYIYICGVFSPNKWNCLISSYSNPHPFILPKHFLINNGKFRKFT